MRRERERDGQGTTTKAPIHLSLSLRRSNSIRSGEFIHDLNIEVKCLL